MLALLSNHNATDGLAVTIEVCNSAAHVWAKFHICDIADTDRTVIIHPLDDRFRKLRQRLCITASADHVLGSTKLDQAPARFLVGSADRIHDFTQRNAIAAQPNRIDVDLELSSKATDGCDFRDAGDGLKLVAECPVLIGTDICRIQLAGFVHKGVLIHPAKPGCIWAKLRLDTFWDALKHARKELIGARTRCRYICAFIKDHIDKAITKVAKATHGFYVGSTKHRRNDGIGHLILDDIRGAIPL